MMNQELLMSPNRLVTFLQKPAAELQKQTSLTISNRMKSAWSILCILLRTDA